MADMQRIYDEINTTFKCRVILRGGEGVIVDWPNVVRHGDKWYMLYVAIKNKIGYETNCSVGEGGRAIAMATSKDLGQAP